MPSSRSGGALGPPAPVNPYEVKELKRGIAGFADELDYVEIRGNCKLPARCQFVEWKKVNSTDSSFGVEAWAAPHALFACITSPGGRPASDDASVKRWQEDAGLVVADFSVEVLTAHGKILGELGLFNKDYQDYQVFRKAQIDLLKTMDDLTKMEVKGTELKDYVL